MYALAASAAGLGVLALSQPADAKIVYTKTHHVIRLGQHYDLDLNRDGITDFNGACSLVYLHRLRPSLCNSQVGSCNYCFGACSAFTHVMACTLAESLNDPLHRKLRQLRCLRCRFDCFRVERTSSRAGVAPAEAQRLSRRTVTPTMENERFIKFGVRRNE